MLTPQYLMGVADPVVQVFSDFEDELVADIAERIVRMGYISETSEWQIMKARELGLLNENVQKRLAEATGYAEAEIEQLMQDAGMKALQYDDAIYRLAGLTPAAFSNSPVLQAILLHGTNDTMQLIRNFTQTRATATQTAFINLCDKAWLQVMSGAYDPATAIRRAINELARMDISKIAYPSGHVSSMENAVRRAVTTGVNQCTAKLQLARADEMGCELVEVTSHAGARPSHAVWQGQVYSLRAHHPKYANFYEATKYGTGEGLCGWNCYHNFFPYFEGLSTPAFIKDPSAEAGRDNNTDYENQQKQRAYERKIRAAKRKCVALNSAYNAAPDSAKPGLKQDFDRAAIRLKKYESDLDDFCAIHDLPRLHEREQTPGFNRSVSARAVWAKRKNP